MVAMVVFVTVISMGFLLWGNLHKGLKYFQDNSEEYHQYVSLTNIIERDFIQATSIIDNNNSLVLKIGNEIITYNFFPDSTVYSNQIKQFNYKIRFKSISTRYYMDTQSINGIGIEFIIQGKPVYFSVSKELKGKSLVNSFF
jgi:hypothetical protein